MSSIPELSIFDVLLPGLPVVFCGINPNVQASMTGHNFASASNRFWPVLHEAGFTPTRLNSQDDRFALRYGCGITAAVSRGTRKATELTSAEFTLGHQLLRAKVSYFRPTFIAFLGKAAVAAMPGLHSLEWGPQRDLYASARVWILPNPSGLNRNFTLRRLIQHYSALREEAGQYLRAWENAQATSDQT